MDNVDHLDDESSDELDPETLAAIEAGLAEADRGEGMLWSEVRQVVLDRFVNKK